MANSKNTSPSLVDTLATLRKQYEAMNFGEEFIEAQLKQAASAMVEPVRKMVTDKLIEAADNVTKTKEFTANIEILKGSRMTVDIMVDHDGKVTVRDRVVTKRPSTSSGGSDGGKRPTLVLDGKPYPNWAELARAHNLDIGGDSAHRVWVRANKSDPEKYPMPDEVEPEEDE